METTKATARRRRSIPTVRHDVPNVPLYAITPRPAHPVEYVLPELPANVLMDALRYAEQSIDAGNGVKNEDIEDFVAAKLGWS